MGSRVINIINYKDYLDKWDYIHSRFSWNAVQHGWFDEFAESTKNKSSTTQMDDIVKGYLYGRYIYKKKFDRRVNHP